jgi:hypothetical protein
MTAAQKRSALRIMGFSPGDARLGAKNSQHFCDG